MTTQLELAAKRLFGEGGLSATNFKVARGSDPNVPAEEVAREVNRALDRLEAGDVEIIDLDALERD